MDWRDNDYPINICMDKRFRSKTNQSQNITTTFVVVVMFLLCINLSCSEEKKEWVAVPSDPEKSYTMKATEVNTLISDSGITRYRLTAQTWLVFGRAKEPYWYFPEGIYVEKFDTTFHTEASIKADTAYYFDKKGGRFIWHKTMKKRLIKPHQNVLSH